MHADHRPEATLAQLALADAQHRTWLRGEFSAAFTDDELAEILQDAYGRALVSLNGEQPPAFEDWPRTLAWFRRVCANTAIDAKRHRDGRRESERAARPTLVPLDPAVHDGQYEAVLAEIDHELEAVVEDADTQARRAVVEALRQIDPKHARVLSWRYVDELLPAAIMRLEGLRSMKQYEGRHRRAIKALGRALAGLELGVDCGQARLILRHRPDALLHPAGDDLGEHVEACPACRAYQHQVRGALAAMPLPIAVMGAKFVFMTRVPAGEASAASQPAAAPPKAAHGLLGQPKLVAAFAAATVLVAGTGAAVAGGRDAAGTTAEGASARKAVATHVFRRAESFAEHRSHDPLLGRPARAVGR